MYAWPVASGGGDNSMRRLKTTRNDATPNGTDADGSADGRYYSGFYPMHLGLLSVATNLFPVAWWTPLSKQPFRLLVAVDRRNYSLELVRQHGEAALHFFPYTERQRIIRAGYLSGRSYTRLQSHPGHAPCSDAHTSGCRRDLRDDVRRELADSDGDHAPFIFDVVYVHRGTRPCDRLSPLLFLGFRDFATLGERWRFRP